MIPEGFQFQLKLNPMANFTQFLTKKAKSNFNLININSDFKPEDNLKASLIMTQNLEN